MNIPLEIEFENANGRAVGGQHPRFSSGSVSNKDQTPKLKTRRDLFEKSTLHSTSDNGKTSSNKKMDELPVIPQHLMSRLSPESSPQKGKKQKLPFSKRTNSAPAAPEPNRILLPEIPSVQNFNEREDVDQRAERSYTMWIWIFEHQIARGGATVDCIILYSTYQLSFGSWKSTISYFLRRKSQSTRVVAGQCRELSLRNFSGRNANFKTTTTSFHAFRNSPPTQLAAPLLTLPT